MASSDIARQFMSNLPYNVALGIEIDDVRDGRAQMSMPYDDRFVGNPAQGVLHGGVVSALMDSSAGAAVLSHPDVMSVVATLDLRIDYLRAATPGQRLIARAHCYHVSRSVAFVSVQTFDDNTDLPVATAAGAFAMDGSAGKEAT
ncbi:thioesterase [Actibacterium mucosum KCTC 23349]|uniref:Thioesterase n=1 Tax=Actibacterium mucosum KCTC 23349 TaxID=1454373 RepID=A0A037ZGF5_9RHOB|nr:PaaI family thioesterase [Actibacterium mucosum]KAJ55223.1 thioesterase [Actibacterium mucosum KCTC 23349]